MLDPDVWGTVSDWVVAVTAVTGVGFGAVQLLAIRRAEEDAAAQARIAAEQTRLAAEQAAALTAQTEQATRAHLDRVQIERARLVVRIDEQFEGADIVASRKAILALRNRFEAEVRRDSHGVSNEQQVVEVAARFSRYMTALWSTSRTFDEVPPGTAAALKDSSADEYFLLMKLPLWIETVGMLCGRGLLPTQDVLDLYDQVIIKTIGNVRTHIDGRRDQAPHPNPGYLEYAVELYELAKANKLQRTRPNTVKPAAASLPWKG